MNKDLTNFAYINGCKIYAPKSKAALLENIKDYKGILVAINAEKILKSDDKLISLINENFGYPDGIGAVWALKKNNLSGIKIAGAEFWLEIIKNFYKTKSFYLIGASIDVITKTIEKLKDEYKGINILGYRDGYIKEEEEKYIIKDIKEKKPDIVFVAMGSPKQEYFMEKIKIRHQALFMGLGGSFDLYTGFSKPVPNWWKKYLKWEGLYRSFNDLTNYKRWRRQLILFKFIYYYIFKF